MGMLEVNVTTMLNKNKIVKRFTTNDKFNKQMAQIVIDETEDYVPFKTGALERSGRAYPGYIAYGQKYAKYLYDADDKHFSKKVHPLAQPHWLEKGYKDRQDRIIARIQEEEKKI